MLVGLAFVSAGVAAGAVKEKTDKQHGVVFHLDGRVLTVTLLQQVNPRPENKRRAVAGHRILAACSTRYHANGEILFSFRRWPANATTLKFRFKFDDSARMHYCAIANLKSSSGDPIASVYFFRQRR